MGTYRPCYRSGCGNFDREWMRPILILANHLTLRGLDRQFVTSTVTDALFDRGYLPVLGHFHSHYQTRQEHARLASAYLEQLAPAGVILQGGDDIHPTHYGDVPKHVYKELLFRDHFELTMVEAALQRKLPVFGICRGMQLLNVACGGTLHQEVHDLPCAIQHMPRRSEHMGDLTEAPDLYTFDAMIGHHGHHVELTPGGVLATAYGEYTLTVNSYHHQGIAVLGDGLRVEARAPDGLIEAVQDTSRKILGVQWHPEVPIHDVLHWEPLDAWLSLFA